VGSELRETLFVIQFIQGGGGLTYEAAEGMRLLALRSINKARNRLSCLIKLSLQLTLSVNDETKETAR
jgi:hypothetical protein